MQTKVAVTLFERSPHRGLLPILRRKSDNTFTVTFWAVGSDVDSADASAHLTSDHAAIRRSMETILDNRVLYDVFKNPQRLAMVLEYAEDDPTDAQKQKKILVRHYAVLLGPLDISNSLELRLSQETFHLTIVLPGKVVSAEPSADYRMSPLSYEGVRLGYEAFTPKKKEEKTAEVQASTPPELVGAGA